MIKKCDNCKKKFVPRKGGKAQRFCCSKCRLIIWREKNKEKTRMACNKWREKNQDYQKKWQEENKDKTRKYQQKYYKKNKVTRLVKSKEWRMNNIEKSRLSKKKWREKNKDRINKLWMDRYYDRYRNDQQFKLSKNLRNRINKILLGINKSSDTLSLLGVKSVNEIKEYIELKFEKGMSWNNYNFETWHIDHIKPLHSFDLTKKEEQKKAFHYTNLQPLWAKDNLIKGSRVNMPFLEKSILNEHLK